MSLLRKILTPLAVLLMSPAAHAAPELGGPAPDFKLQDQNGAWHSLEQYRGQWIALYFYPKDDTPGCTKEACAFRDNIFAFDAINAVILGISLDDVASHAKFAEKYSLPFPLLADTEKQAANVYGVYTKIVTFEIAKRQSFLIDPQGNIAKHYESVDPANHSAEVLADLQQLVSAAN